MESGYSQSARARIACVFPQEEPSSGLAKALQDTGYDISASNAGADLGLIDLRNSAFSPRKARAIAGVLRRKAPECAIVFLVDPGLDQSVRAALRRCGEVVPCGDAVDHVLARCRQTLRLRNIAEETGERLKTLAGLSRLVDFPLVSGSDDPARILIAGAPAPAAMAAINAVSAVSTRCECVMTAGQAMRALDHSQYDCALLLPMHRNDPMTAFSRALRRHDRHAGMAVIQVAHRADDLPEYARIGARDFILASHLDDDLGVKVQMAARRARLIRSMRDFLHACAGEGVRDNASGAFTSTFLSEHGARLCGRADQTGRPLAMTLIRLSAGPRDAAPDRRALRQAARLINRVIRAEDLVARIAQDKFIVLCPATTATDARAAASRIEGVLSNTAFRGADDACPYAVTAHTHVLARAPGASIEECVAALLKQAQDKGAVKANRS